MPGIIYTSVKSAKKVNKKPGWRQREEEYNAWLKSHGVTTSKKTRSSFEPYKPAKSETYQRETQNIPSLNPQNMSPCAKSADKVYTGTAMKGIGTMHKSNCVPIFSDEEAKNIATMRRN